ncbi:MAG: exo-alpha-sialidase [Hyphomicrobiaceae bacterium]|nr:exo-alpha-sialidase [Hyphomicrobiaceae bacterium]
MLGWAVQAGAAAALAALFYATAPAYDNGWRWAHSTTLSAAKTASPEPLFEERIIDKGGGGFQHAATIIKIGNEFIAFWYSGEYEGTANSAIKAARFDGKAWSAAFVVTDQMSTARELGRFIKTVGNAVPYITDDGALHLFYTVVPMRGWSTANLAVKSSFDGGRTWTAARRLISSPLLNLSTMVKSAPLAGTNGSILLPAYWSLGTQYPLVLQVGKDMRVTGLHRMGNNRAGLQPTIMPVDDDKAVGFLRRLRDARKTGLRTTLTKDGGKTWSKPAETGLPNQGTPTVGLRLAKDRILAIFSERNEGILSFGMFNDDGSVRARMFTLPTKFRGNKAYPYAIQDADGTIDLMFSCEDNTAICHVRFNEAWVEQQSRQVSGAAP